MNLFHPPRRYQREGAFWLARRSGGILGWAVGVGKTYGSLLAVLEMKAKRVLVISPKSLKAQWSSEIDKFLGTDHAGVGFTLAHYEQFIDNSKHLSGYLRQKWDVVIVDEVHNLSNRKAQRTKNIKKLKTQCKIGLTGTPIRERPDQLWSLLNWLNKKEFSSFWTFVRLYCDVETGYGFGHTYERIAGIRYQLGSDGQMSKDITLKLLQERVKDYILVKRLEDVGLELPPLTVTDVPIELEPDQLAFYIEVKKQIIIELTTEHGEPDEWDLSGENQLIIRNGGARFTRLQQAASAPTVFKDVSNAKLNWLWDYVDGGGEPAVIMTRFNHSAMVITDLLRKLGVADRFLVGTYGTLAEGLNLQNYRVLIAWDAPESRLKWEQAEGRIRRMGQERPQHIYRLAGVNTVDERCWRLIDNKQAEVNLILDWLREVKSNAKKSS